MRYVFIVNGFSGKGKTQKKVLSDAERIFEKRSLKFEVFETEYQGHATKIARKVAEKGDEVTIFSCGGEGTNFEVINGIVGYDNVTLGIVPCGTGNDFIKFFGSKEPFLDIEDQLSGSQRNVNLIKVGYIYGINSCSAGMDAMVADNTRFFKKWPFVSGKLAYNLGVVYTFFQRFKQRIDLHIDHKVYNDVGCLFAVCANAPFYGGSYKCAPMASPFDSELDYSIIETTSKFKILSMLGLYRKGEHIKLNYCRHGRCKRMEFHSDKPIVFNIDGEIFNFKDAVCEIKEKGLRLLLPKSVFERFKDEEKTVAKVR